MKKENKNKVFQLRVTENDKSQIAKLAKKLGLNKSEAIRSAVISALAIISK